MARMRFAGVALALALALVAGCNTRAIELSAEDDGSTQRLAVGQGLTVQLDSNPTTGYRWALDGELPGGLEQIGEPEYVAGSDAIGAGGTELWRFRGAAAGSAELKLKYWRSFEPTAPPEGRFSATIEIE